MRTLACTLISSPRVFPVVRPHLNTTSVLAASSAVPLVACLLLALILVSSSSRDTVPPWLVRAAKSFSNWMKWRIASELSANTFPSQTLSLLDDRNARRTLDRPSDVGTLVRHRSAKPQSNIQPDFWVSDMSLLPDAPSPDVQ